MANAHLDTAFVDRAIKFAVDAHAGTERRGKGFPYVIHVLEAMEIVASISNDPELLAAAALHDTVEDTGVTIDEIRAGFGDRVASLVASETDEMPVGANECDTWRARKQAAIDRIAASSRDAKIVALGDKLSNMRAIARDYRAMGDKLWDRFHAPGGKPDHEWHYRGLAGALCDLVTTDAYQEFVTLLKKVFDAPKPELIDMSQYELSGDGFTAKSYFHRDGKHMIKLYEDFIPEEVPQDELKVNWKLLDIGIKTPVARRLVTDGKRIGVEFDRINPKKSYARAISEEPERLEEYVLRFARRCKELHSMMCDGSRFESVAAYFKQVIDESVLYDEDQKARMKAFVDSVPETGTCLHGDMHIGNIITDGRNDWWIDLSDFRYGNPLFDFGMFYFLCRFSSDELSMQLFHIPYAQMGRVWEVFVPEYFGPDADIEEIDQKCRPFAALYMVMFGNRRKLYPGMAEFIEDNLLKIKQ